MSVLLTQRLKDLSGIDRAVVWTLAPRLWRAAFGPITVMLIARQLTVVEQGYYFTFASLAGIQLLFELGLATVIQPFVSHERAFLELAADGTLSGNGGHKERLGSLVRQAFRWYAIAAALLALTLLVGGTYFFASAGSNAGGWRGPWTAIAIAGSLMLFVNFALVVLEGCGFVADAARSRTWQTVVAQILLWGSLIAHARLWAPAIAQIGALTTAGAWLVSSHRRLFVDLLRSGEGRFGWWREIWPLQWRTALSWAGNYFILQAFTPLLFLLEGPASAGRMGMSLTIMNIVMSVAMVWLLTKRPFLAMLIARRDFAGLDALFFPAMARSILVMLAGMAAVLGGAYTFGVIHHPWSARLLPLPALVMLSVALIAMHVAWTETIYLRAHKQEVIVPVRLMAAALTVLLAILLGDRWGALGMMAGFLAVSVTVSLGGNTWLFVSKRREWHA